MRISDWSSDVCSSDLLAKIVLRLPPEQRPCARDVEDIVVVAAVDHPRLDEVVATECFVLQNDPCFCERLRDTDCLPALAVERLADDVLDFGVTGRVGFADKQWQFRRKVASPDRKRTRLKSSN